MCKFLLLCIFVAVMSAEDNDSVEGDWLEEAGWWREGRFAFPRYKTFLGICWFLPSFAMVHFPAQRKTAPLNALGKRWPCTQGRRPASSPTKVFIIMMVITMTLEILVTVWLDIYHCNNQGMATVRIQITIGADGFSRYKKTQSKRNAENIFEEKGTHGYWRPINLNKKNQKFCFRE